MTNTKKFLILIFFFSFLSCATFGQSFTELYEKGLKLYEQQNYVEAENCFKEALKYGEKKDKVHFFLGMCSAFQDRLEEAENHFRVSLTLNSLFEECYIELAGIYFMRKEYQKAEQMIEKAIKINSDNTYSHDFLGTLYYISGLTTRALYEWNKINKPILAGISQESENFKRKGFVSKELCFNPGQMIKPSMITESKKRLEKIGNISNVSFHLVPHEESQGEFNLLFSFYEERGVGENLGFFLINLLRDIPQKTLHLDYKNIFDKNINIYTAYRFDSSRKKYHVLLTFPRFSGLPFYTSLAYTYKSELWSVHDFLPGQQRVEGRIKTGEFVLKLDYIHDDKISYSHYLKFKTRNVPDSLFLSSKENNLLSPSLRKILSFGGELNFNLFNNLQKNLSSDFSLACALMSGTKRDRSRYIKLLLTLENIKAWRKSLSEEARSELLWRLRLGYSSSEIPLEDKFILGIGPDIQYDLRAHSSTQEGKLGYSPIVNRFVLSNLQYSHHLFNLLPFKIEGGMFADCAHVFGEKSLHYKDEFIVDIGVFSKIYLFKFPFILSYGYNFKENKHSVYLSSHMRF